MDEGCKKEVKKKAVKVGDELDVLGIDLNRFLMEVGFLIAFLKITFHGIWVPKVEFFFSMAVYLA